MGCVTSVVYDYRNRSLLAAACTRQMIGGLEVIVGIDVWQDLAAGFRHNDLTVAVAGLLRLQPEACRFIADPDVVQDSSFSNVLSTDEADNERKQAGECDNSTRIASAIHGFCGRECCCEHRHKNHQ